LRILHKAFFLSIILIALTLSASAEPESAEASSSNFFLVYNAELGDLEITRKQARSLFTLKQSKWINGSSVQVISLNSTNKYHKQFVEQELNLFPYQVKRLWARQVFSSSAKKPIFSEDFESLIEHVARTKDAIGYITKDQLKAIDNDKIIVTRIK
jgi:ABC-type phosphate transport system substrate-binding protein